MLSKISILHKLTFWSAILFLFILLCLHFLKPEVDPSWQMISEYEIGKNGWMMRVAFLILGFSYITLFFAIIPNIKTVVGRIGLALLLLSAIGAFMGGIFITDPMLTENAQMTMHAKLHGVGFLLGVPGFPVAASLISRSLAHHYTNAYSKKSLLWGTILTWIGLLVMMISVAVLLPKGAGKFNDKVLIGWPNRFLIVSYTLWIIILAREGIKNQKIAAIK